MPHKDSKLEVKVSKKHFMLPNFHTISRTSGGHTKSLKKICQESWKDQWQ